MQEKQQNLLDVIQNYVILLKEGKASSLAPLLATFKLGSKSMNLKTHFQFEPLYKTISAKRTIWKCGRQCGKSFGIASRGILRAGLLPNYHILFVQPRFDQIKRFSQTIVKLLLKNWTLYKLLVDTEGEQNVLTKEFKCGSRFHMEYTFLSADRVRGLSGISELNVDEIADIDFSFLPILAETMSATIRYGLSIYTGTPKTTDNTLEVLWQDSSMAEWAVKCLGCNKTNIPAADQDLLKMIGKQGLICAKCGKPIDARNGYYVHAFPDRRTSFEGYHISQPIHPLHYAIPSKWQDLLYKLQNYNKAKFFNEVLGEACDESVKLLTKADIVQAANFSDNDMAKAATEAKKYEMLVMGVDWSGGGELSHSYTAIAICGIKPTSDVIDCIYCSRLPHGLAPAEESKLLAQIANMFGVTYIAHDYTGAGYLREAMLIQAGIPTGHFLPFTYVVQPTKAVINWNQATGGARASYSLDKARSLMVLCAMMKAKKVTVPKWEYAGDILSDLLALMENPKELERGNILFLITSKPKMSDDFAHALNFACSALWHARQAYPNLAEAEKFKIPESELALPDPSSILL